MLSLTRIFHQTHGRSRRIATQDRHQATICAEAIGIEVLEEDGLTRQAIEVYCHTCLSAKCLHQMIGEALQNQEHHFWPLSSEKIMQGVLTHIYNRLKQRVWLIVQFYLRISEIIYQSIGLIITHKAVLVGEIALLTQRLHQIERGVYCRMIQNHFLTEIHMTCIHGGF